MTKGWAMGAGAAAAVAALLAAEPASAQGAAANAAATASAYMNASTAATAASAVAESLGNLEVVNQGSLRYRWKRDGVVVELRNRNGSWTLEEARRVGRTMDRLPVSFVRKAVLAGMKQVYRDGALPTAPWDLLSDPRDSLAGVAVPPSPWNFIALGDNAFKDERKTYRVTIHEIAHCVQWYYSGWGTVVGGTAGWTSISWTTGMPGTGLKSWNGFVSNYARGNHMEDFASSATTYWLNPEELRRVSQAKYNYMRYTAFDGHVSPQSARDPEEKALEGWLLPEVTKLGDTKDEWYSVVEVYGNRFMGPFDGGFNVVRYRGYKAFTHLPISRTHITSWVPAIREGSAPVSVRTQDGVSNSVDFKVEEPWWHFW